MSQLHLWRLISINFILQHLHGAFKEPGVPINEDEECIALGFADDLVITSRSLSDAITMSKRLNLLLNQIEYIQM